jgi:hypothetical protein
LSFPLSPKGRSGESDKGFPDTSLVDLLVPEVYPQQHVLPCQDSLKQWQTSLGVSHDLPNAEQHLLRHRLQGS